MGVSVDHEPKPAGIQLLERFAEPINKPCLLDNLSDLTETELDYQLDELQKVGLVFRENERYFSLIVDSEQG